MSSLNPDEKKPANPNICSRIKYIISVMDHFSVGRMMETARFIHERSGKSTPVILADMVYCALRYNAGYNDYRALEFYSLDSEQRATYVTRGISNGYVAALNDKNYRDIFDDKVKFAAAFRQYFRRGFICLDDVSPGEFAAFLESRDKIIAKPRDGTNGNGVAAFSGDELKEPDKLYARLKESGQTLVEEFIVQHPGLSLLSPDSVNTLRLLTILKDGKVHLIFSGIRMGCGGVADNLGSGGIAAVIDPATGLIGNFAQDKWGNMHETHPVTGVRIPGTPVPFYREAVDMVSEAALVIPQIRYIAWDVAIAPDGPVLVEGNQYPGHSIYQLRAHLGPDRKGLKPLIDSIIAG